MIYALAIFISVFFAYQAQNLDINSNKTLKINYLSLGIISFFPAFFLSALRNYSVGTDTAAIYLPIYNKVVNNIKIRDVGYGVIVKISDFLFHSYSGVLILTSLLICVIAYICIFRDSKYQAISTLLFFVTNVYFISMNMVRQTLATMIFLFAIKYIKEKKIFKYIIAILIATTIHTSAIIYLPLYFIFKVKLNPKISSIVILLIAVFKGIFFKLFILVLNAIPLLKESFGWYFSSDFNTGSFNLIGFLVNISIFAYLLFINKEAKKDKDYNILLWTIFIAVCGTLLSSYIPLMRRICMLFTFTIFIYLPNTFRYIKNINYRKYIIAGICSCYTIYCILTIFILGHNGVFPYIFR